MVIGLVSYVFDLAMDKKTGEISPSFKNIQTELSESHKKLEVSDILSFDDLMKLYY